MQQPPVRHASRVGSFVYSHSGEFAPWFTDLHLPGRGLDLQLTRTFRSSSADIVGALGRGWSTNLAQWLEPDGDDVLVHDGSGRVLTFSRARDGELLPPPGYYATLMASGDQCVIQYRFGVMSRYAPLERGGQLLGIEDRNANALTFARSRDAVEIRDTLGQSVTILLSDGLYTEVADGSGRVWTYGYDAERRLVRVTRPATTDFPRGTSLDYAYDDEHRLIALTNANGQTYLQNRYDGSGRVVAQDHGRGTYLLDYETVGEGIERAHVYRTSCRDKNGSTVVFEHNPAGNVTVLTQHVGQESFTPKDIAGAPAGLVPVVTTSSYDDNLELVHRRFPSGRESGWEFSTSDDPLQRGNMTRHTLVPQPEVDSDQESIVTEYTYEARLQLLSSWTDPRGGVTSFDHDASGNVTTTTYPTVSVQPVDGDRGRPAPVEMTMESHSTYNSRGQLLRRMHIGGAVSQYSYYPVDDPGGARGRGTATTDPDQVCGRLARVVHDAEGAAVTNEYSYDVFGNLSAVFDGKGSAALLSCNALGQVERVTGRAPFNHQIDYHYDADGNQVESGQAFGQRTYDDATRSTVETTVTLRERRDYNVLGNLVGRWIGGGGGGGGDGVGEYFERDRGERVVRLVQPLGNATEYRFDERDLLTGRTFAAGTVDGVDESFTYTLDGAAASCVNGNGERTTYHYDGYQRYRGFTDAAGTTHIHRLDAADNVVSAQVRGDDGGDGPVLAEERYHLDQWNRIVKLDRAWHDPQTGDPIGASSWDGEPGQVCTVVEYARDGRGVKTWSESGNVEERQYDGAGRLIATSDLTGQRSSCEYDENGNVTRTTRGKAVADDRTHRVVSNQYDEMDRIVSRQEDDGAPERLGYDALSTAVDYAGRSGIRIHHLTDSLGRHAGHWFPVVDADSGETNLVRRSYELDDNDRLAAYSDAKGNRTTYGYDGLGRQTDVHYPDDQVARIEYDPAGNRTKTIDPLGNEIDLKYDAAARLVECSGRAADTGITTTHSFRYDPAGRLLSATSPDAVTRCTFDSLSLLRAEQQDEHELRCAYDGSGNLVSLAYPGGDEVHTTFDLRNRVVAVQDTEGAPLATYRYGANDQVVAMSLGGTVQTDLFYDMQHRLAAVEYHNADQTLIEGFRYAYDRAGRVVHEIQLARGESYGDRYSYDDAGRATRAQYGVEDVRDPDSGFERQTSYEHFPDGGWSRRVDLDGRTGDVQDQVATVDQRNRYQRFGELEFSHDANGNQVEVVSADRSRCRYSYDAFGRLIRAEYLDAEGNTTQTIEYSYDAFGRQVRKVVTNANGVRTSYGYVWAGWILIEEYENDVLVRTYRYGQDLTPVSLSSHRGGRADYVYVLNGSGRASGLLYAKNPSRFAEKYTYELTGAGFLSQLHGVTVGRPSGHTRAAGLANSILSGGHRRSTLTDLSNGTLAGLGGVHLNPQIAAVLNGNSVISGGKGHTSGDAVFDAQRRGLFDSDSGHSSQGSQGGALGSVGTGSHRGMASASGGFINPKMRLYASDSGKNTWDNFHYTAPTATEPKTVLGRLTDFANKSVSIGPLDISVKDVAAGVAEGLKAPSDPPFPKGTGPVTPGPHLTSTEAAQEEKKHTETTSAEQKQRDKDAADKAANDKAAADKAAADAQAKEKAKTYVNPDADTADFGAGYVLSPAQLEAHLNQVKHPVNPGGGGGTTPVDPSSPPPRHGGLDPTVAYLIDDDGWGEGWSGALGSPRPSIAPLDYVQGWTPPVLEPPTGGTIPINTHTWT